MEAPAHAVKRDDLQIRRLLPRATVTKPSKDWIVCENGGGGSHCATKAQVLLRRIIPGSAVHGLAAQPGGIVGRWFETAAAAAIVGRPRIPVTVIRRRPAVHRGPAVEIRRVTQAK